MGDWRTKIAALALVLGLGGLGGYAISSNPRAEKTTGTSVPATEVIRRTVHAKPRRDKRARESAAAASRRLASRPVATGTSGSSSSSYSPVGSGTSGSGGASRGGEREDDDEGEGLGDD